MVGKVLIIGLDGLDVNLVNRWKINTFKQISWGSHFVGFLNTIHTLIVWPCFLTGLNVEKFGFNSDAVRKQLEDIFPNIIKYLYKARKALLKNVKLGLREFLMRLHIIRYPTAKLPKELLEKTFLEIAKNSGLKVTAIDVPGYNEKSDIIKSLNLKYITKPLEEKIKYLDKLLNYCKKSIDETYSALLNDNDLIFVWLPLPDRAHHILFKGVREIVYLRIIYSKISNLVKPILREAYKRNYITLIISDHGFDIKNYDHSKYGFWSLNIETSWRPDTILDFYPKILEWLSLRN